MGFCKVWDGLQLSAMLFREGQLWVDSVEKVGSAAAGRSDVPAVEVADLTQ